MEGNDVSINGISSQLMGLQQMAPMRAHEPLAPSEDLALEASIEPAANITKAKAFYEYEKEPWLTEPGFEHVKNRLEYVQLKKIYEQIDVGLIKFTYDEFRKDLEFTHPEISNKAYGFTLSETGNIKIIDYDNNLTENDKEVLTKSINEFKEFKNQLQNHARSIMTLLDHDHETFGGRYKLDISNFQNIIDYGKVMSASFEKMQSAWIEQVKSNAEKMEFSYLSVSA